MYWPQEGLKVDINCLFLTRANLNNPLTPKFSFGEIDTAKLFSRLSFNKAEHLKSDAVIGLLFNSGRPVTQHPLKALWLPLTLKTPYPVQVCITAPKKKFPKAWQRNKVKRIVREAYRHHKKELYEYLVAEKTQMALVIIFTGKEIPTFELISEKMVNIIEQLRKDHALLASNPG